MCRAAALWPLLFLTFMFIAVLTTMDHASIGIFIFLGCILGLLLWYWIGLLHSDEMRESQSIQIGDIESEGTHGSLAATTRTVVARVRAQREPYWHDVQLLSFAPRVHIVRLAMRALPPVICFCGDETTGSQRDCPICIEEFKKGELIQPFGVCVHEFHSSCINSWLLGGKTTCPVCRKELSTTIS